MKTSFAGRVVGAFLLLVLCATNARAEEPASSPCESLLGLESLPVTDREFLSGICELEPDDAGHWKIAEKAEFERLKRLAQRTVEASFADASTLINLLPAGVFQEQTATIHCAEETLAEQIQLALAGSLKGEDREADPKKRSTGTLSLHRKCPLVAPQKTAAEENTQKPTTGENTEQQSSTTGTLRPWTVLAPEGSTVLLIVGGKDGGLLAPQQTKWKLGDPSTDSSTKEAKNPKRQPAAKNTPVAKNTPAAKNGPDDPHYTDPATQLTLYTAEVPFGVPFVALVRPGSNGEAERRRQLAQAILDGVPYEEDPPFVLQGVLNDEYTAYGLPQTAACVDIQIASRDRPRVFLNGAPLTVPENNGVFARTVWIPTDARNTNWEHNLLVLLDSEAGPVVGATKTLHPAPEQGSRCIEAHYDLTREVFTNTIGLFRVDADECTDAGIDRHKIRAAVEGFVEQSGWRLADLTGWAQNNEVVARLGESSGRVRASAGRPRTKSAPGYGASRGQMDTIDLFASGGEELLRQGFSRVLDVGLSCSQRGDGNWDYSFQARVVNLKRLAERKRDSLTGVDLDGIVDDDIELILERDELRIGIETTLGRLLERPSIGLRSMPKRQNFVDRLAGNTVVYVPEGSTGHHFLDLAYVPLSEESAVTVCGGVERTNELRTKRANFDLPDSESWRTGLPSPIEPSATERTVPIYVQQTKARHILVRARLLRTREPMSRQGLVGKPEVLAESFRCTDMSRPPVELWTTVSGWFNTRNQSPTRAESTRGVVVAIGMDWLNDVPWISFGMGISYAHTWRQGSRLPIWDGLDSPDDLFSPQGGVSYEIREHSIMGVAGQVLPGGHFIDTTGIPPELSVFRGASGYDFFDVGMFLGAGIGIDTGTFRFFARYSLGTRRIGDYFRDPSVAGVNPTLLYAPTMGAAWEF